MLVNESIENYKASVADRNKLAEAHQAKINEQVAHRESFTDKFYAMREAREIRERRRPELLEAAKTDALATAIKAIYIGALEANTLTDDGIMLAEQLVDSWIKENGGATKILNRCMNESYFLARLTQIVEDAAEEEVKEIEKDEDVTDEEKEAKETREKEESDDKSDEDKEEKDLSDDPLNDTFDDSEDENKSEEEEPSDEDDIIIDEPESNSIDGEEENKGKVFEELEKEEDVQKAVELIRQRVADAEQTFIKRNAEDKKQIDELLSKISDNVKTIEDMDEDSKEAKLAQESARLSKQKINNITENRPLTVFEKMTRNLQTSIIKNEVVREHYTGEDGKVDTASIVESAKVMYAFLETLNTLKLVKVDKAYIEKTLEEMK